MAIYQRPTYWTSAVTLDERKRKYELCDEHKRDLRKLSFEHLTPAQASRLITLALPKVADELPVRTFMNDRNDTMKAWIAQRTVSVPTEGYTLVQTVEPTQPKYVPVLYIPNVFCRGGVLYWETGENQQIHRIHVWQTGSKLPYEVRFDFPSASLYERILNAKFAYPTIIEWF